jgi:hypothetical protein
MAARKLTVKSERLAELTTDDLSQVVAGSPTQVQQTLQVNRDCLHTVFGCTTAIDCP